MAEKKMSRRGYLKYLGAGVVVAAIGGAGYYYYTTTGTTTPNTTASTTTPAGGYGFEVWDLHSEESLANVIQDCINSFIAGSSNTGEVLIVPESDFYAKFSSALAANALPDVVLSDVSYVKSYIETGAFVPLDDIIEQLGGMAQFPEPVMNLYASQGKHYGINVYNTEGGLNYRKDILDKYGVKPPTTWDEWLNVAKACTDPSKGIYGFGMASGTSVIADWGVSTIMKTNGATIFDETGENVVFDSPETVETFEFLKQLFQYAPKETASWSWAESKRAIWDGLCATTWYLMISTIKDTMRYNSAVLPYVGIASTPKKKEYAVFNAPSAWLVPSQGKNVEEAKKLAYLLSTPQWVVKQGLTEIDYVPATKDAMARPEYWADSRIDQNKDLIKSMTDLVAYAYPYAGGAAKSSAVIGANLTSQALQEVLYKSRSPSDVVTEYQKKIEDAIK